MFDTCRQWPAVPPQMDDSSDPGEIVPFFYHDADFDLTAPDRRERFLGCRPVYWYGVLLGSTIVGLVLDADFRQGPMMLADLPPSGDVEDVTAGEPAALTQHDDDAPF